MHKVDIGLVFSTTGPYGALGRNALAGAQLAIRELAADDAVRIDAHHVDPQGRPELYRSMTAELLAERGIRHLVGGITSWSRKDMIPVLERYGALLWYPCPYEGFEANDHVVYLGGCPNQHLLPLLDRMIAAGHRRAFLIGSDYVWGWETLRIARERLSAAGVEIMGEQHILLGDRDCAEAVTRIAETGCDLVVNSLIGPSNHAFVRAMARLTPRPQLVSANQTEADLDEMGASADGMLSIAPWFDAGSGEGLRGAEAGGARASCFFATSYVAIHLLAQAIRSAGDDHPIRVFDAIKDRRLDTVLGPLRIDPGNRHTELTPRIAVAQGGRFDVVETFAAPVPPDPYLIQTGQARTPLAPADRPSLRLVE
ncbi:transporter substrate-binding protein [Paracoccus jeotgali]|uniref:Amidase n=1 Tax=Paracoccus jeotgali TaxID=2065379 RepID=A0A2K9MHN5_9RHOB|nr:transporter substrate-binding protein [Paracoccus jeotgali]AUM75148.1 hypothetical protein CYR75_13365 [Paracoccus jeotgali]